MNRTLETTLDNILSLISCARDYGFENEILFHAFAGMLDERLSDEEIEGFARGIEAHKGYGHEDYLEAKERLVEFKEKYI